MDILLFILRLVHILTGITWVGALIFNAVFLGPAIRDAGPEGGKVMGILVKRGLPKIMPVIALFTLISGTWLYYRTSLGWNPTYMRSGPGMAFGTGGALGILTLLLGATLLAPKLNRMGQIGQAMATAAPADKERLGAELQALRAKVPGLSNFIAVLGVLAAAVMSVARYVQ